MRKLRKPRMTGPLSVSLLRYAHVAIRAGVLLAQSVADEAKEVDRASV